MIRSLIFIASLLAVQFGLSQQIFGQDEAVLRVVVISEDDGRPLVGANVLIFGEGQDIGEDQPYHFAVSNRDGFAEIRGLNAGTDYRLRVTSVGFIPYLEEFSLVSEERRIIRVEMETEVAKFGELIVEGERMGSVGQAGLQRIRSEQLSRVPTAGTGGDLVSYLQTVPGIITSGDRGGNLFIRGGTPDMNRVFVDDLPVVKPFHISNLFSSFPEEILQNVDLYAGGFDASYSGATSAIIDVSLRQGNMRQTEASAAVSPYLFSVLAEGPIKKNSQSYLLSFRKSTIENVAPEWIGEEIPIQLSDMVGRYTLQAEELSCSFTGMYTSDSGEIIPGRNIDQEWSNLVLGARCLGYAESLNHPIRASVGYTDYRSGERSDIREERSSDLAQLYLDLVLQQQFFGMPVDYGFRSEFYFFNTTLQERFTDVESFTQIVPVVSLYTSLEWEVSRSITIQPGISSQISLVAPATLEPRLRLSIRPFGTRTHELGLAAGRYVQFYSGITDERDVGSVFTVLKPVDLGDPVPSSLHGILSYQLNIQNRFRANLEGYVKSHDNIAVSRWNPEVGIDVETALANGYAYGFDARMEYQTRSLFTSVSYGWSQVEYEAATGDLGAWINETVFSYNPLHDQRHKLNAIISYDVAGFTATARWEYGSGKPFTQIFGYDILVRVPFELPENVRGEARTLYSRPFGERLPPYHRLDLSLKRDFCLGQYFEVTSEAGVINAYNRSNVFNFDVNTMQRVDQTPIFPYLSLKLQL